MIQDPYQPAQESDQLPTEEQMRRLAQLFLEHQHIYWPQVVHLPSPAVIHEQSISLAADFAERLRAGANEMFFPPKLDPPPWKEFAACYLRHEASSTPSLEEQLSGILKLAKNSEHFIPWQFVFADVGSSRAASRVMRQLMEAQRQSWDPTVLYLPHFISRNRNESIGLAQAVWAAKKTIMVA